MSRERKQEIIAAIVENRATRGPVHAELDLTDRCNVACYFCNQQDLRTKESIPLPKLTDLIDELVEGGLKSVRLSGGGDPLFHRDVVNVMDHLESRGIIIDNLTTNGVALTPEIATRLVNNKAREVIFSLNAADAADYGRMMKVKPALFDKVITNIKNLVATRGDSMYPSIVAQFLLDQKNVTRIVDMYELGKALGVDRVAMNAVLEVPMERIDREVLLTPEDRFIAEPLVEEMLRRDKEVGLVQVDFAVDKWNEMLQNVRNRVNTPAHNSFPTAPSFKTENGGCFFAWYTTAITGNGDIRPCCLLLNPNVKPLGNVHEGKFADHWNGPAYTKMRDEMREVLLMKGKVPYSEARFQVIKEPCVTENLCWLKNMYFRADEEFYAELGTRLDEARRKEVALVSASNKSRGRAVQLFVQERPRLKKSWDWLRESSRPARIFLKSRLGIDLTDAV